jgi:hypothetical protein
LKDSNNEISDKSLKIIKKHNLELIRENNWIKFNDSKKQYEINIELNNNQNFTKNHFIELFKQFRGDTEEKLSDFLDRVFLLLYEEEEDTKLEKNTKNEVNYRIKNNNKEEWICYEASKYLIMKKMSTNLGG